MNCTVAAKALIAFGVGVGTNQLLKEQHTGQTSRPIHYQLHLKQVVSESLPVVSNTTKLKKPRGANPGSPNKVKQSLG